MRPPTCGPGRNPGPTDALTSLTGRASASGWGKNIPLGAIGKGGLRTGLRSGQASPTQLSGTGTPAPGDAATLRAAVRSNKVIANVRAKITRLFIGCTARHDGRRPPIYVTEDSTERLP